jgi:hypothetical protein
MVSTIEFARVQQIIRSRSNSTSHHRLNDDFPLRGQIRCPSCEMLMTGYFAQGRSQRYPYYRCFSDSCATRTRSYPANAAHDEFLEFVAETSVPHHLACSVITEVIAVGWDSTQQMRKTIDGRNDEVRRVKRQLQELISMRTARLVADDEFTIQRDQLRTKLIDLDAGSIEGIKFSLTDADIAAVATGVSNLKAAWRTMPNESKRGFVEILLPAGYVFLRVRTAEKGLLFKTLEASGRGLPYVVPLIRENANALMAEIRRLLAVIRPVEKPKSEAA